MTEISKTNSAKKHRVGNIRLDAVSLEDLLQIYAGAIERRSKTLILHQNLHGIYIERQNPRSRAIYARADWVYVDGMAAIWLAKAAGLPLQAEHRLTLMDCFDQMLDRAAQKHWRIFYLGGKQEVLDTGLAAIRDRRPSLQITGRNGYFRAEQQAEILEEIRRFKPDVLFVGLGMPIQELWVADHYDALQVPVITTSGATMEYISGHSGRPPAWAGKFGLYGVLRLLAQPKRLWKRYLLEPFVLLPYLVKAILQERRKQRAHTPVR